MWPTSMRERANGRKSAYSIGAYERRVKKTLTVWRREGRVERLWRGDAGLWTGGDEGRWVGWLHGVDRQLRLCGDLKRAAQEVQEAGFEDVLLLGMGGSSLCAEVLSLTFGRVEGYPRLRVLDSTVPAQVRRFADGVDLEKTLCVVASKSGTTTEPNAFCDYFLEEMKQAVGERAGAHFGVITDPGSPLEARARKEGFRYVFEGVPEIGGRYSALSNFGMVPAAMMGIDVEAFLRRAARMVARCGADVPAEKNPGVVLGVVLGELAAAGRDKVTLVTSPGIRGLGTWLEQLLAESTGKGGKGLVAVDNEPLGPPEVYGEDRLFVYIRLTVGYDPGQDEAVGALERAAQPVVRVHLEDAMGLGGAFFLWEVATAVAGCVLGIHPFDQPDVQESKAFTARLMDDFEVEGRLPAEAPFLCDGGVQVFADGENAAALAGAASLEVCLAAHLARLKPGDFAALCAYLDMNDQNRERLQAIRLRIRDSRGVATTVGYGPRFLHATGQLHKGGPNSGLFLQITSDDAGDLPIPGSRASFGTLKAAQALGDALALSGRCRRTVRVHLSAGVEAGLRRLLWSVERAVQHMERGA